MNRFLSVYEREVTRFVHEFLARTSELLGIYCEFYEPIRNPSDIYAEVDLTLTYNENTSNHKGMYIITGLFQNRPAIKYYWTNETFLWTSKYGYVPPPDTRIMLSRHAGGDVFASFRVTDKPPTTGMNYVLFYKFEIVPYEQSFLEGTF